MDEDASDDQVTLLNIRATSAYLLSKFASCPAVQALNQVSEGRLRRDLHTKSAVNLTSDL